MNIKRTCSICGKTGVKPCQKIDPDDCKCKKHIVYTVKGLVKGMYCYTCLNLKDDFSASLDDRNFEIGTIIQK